MNVEIKKGIRKSTCIFDIAGEVSSLKWKFGSCICYFTKGICLKMLRLCEVECFIGQIFGNSIIRSKLSVIINDQFISTS